MEEITSRNNERIKAAAALLSLSARGTSGLFLIEGARLCADAAENGTEITELFVTAKAMEKYAAEFGIIKSAARTVFLISESVAERLSDTKNTQQIFCVCKKKTSQTVINPNGFYVLAENIQSPDNLGAVSRSAEALGADGLVVFSGCDIYNPKALRASMGALIRFPVITVENAVEFVRKSEENGMKTYTSSVSASAAPITEIDTSGGIVCVIGNEGNGVSDELSAACRTSFTIPMKGRAQSLNAAAAAAICIWEFMKQR